MILFRDPEDLALALKPTNVTAMQVSRGEYLATWFGLAIEEWSLQHICFIKGQAVCAGDAPQSSHAFVIPLSRTPGFRLLGHDVSDQTLAAYAPGSEHVDTTTGGCCQVVLVAPSSFAAFCEEERRVLPQSGSHIVRSPANNLATLKELLRQLQQAYVETKRDGATPECRRALSDALTCALAEAMPYEVGADAATGRPKMPRAAILKRIMEIIEASDGQTVYAGELAKAVGISQASLQRAFQEWFGMPPARYLLLRRFYIARKRLRERRARTVTDVAGDLGFWDMSRFSKTYRLLFSETPSDTLRGARIAIQNRNISR